ncbi:MAG: hypothetical protein AAF558_00095 [Verrucomicrobiota bacterium]
MILNGGIQAPWFVAHELEHVLEKKSAHYTSSDQHEEIHNLMVDYKALVQKGGSENNQQISGAKRIYESQNIK